MALHSTYSGIWNNGSPQVAFDVFRFENGLIQELMDVAFIGGDYSNITKYISPEKYLQHNPGVADGLDGFNEFVKRMAEQNIFMKYAKCHQILAEGDFVLTLADGTFGESEVAYFDLFRLENRLIVEHWDIVTEIPPRADWKNENGKF